VLTHTKNARDANLMWPDNYMQKANQKLLAGFN
jgi:hypothetical protein